MPEVKVLEIGEIQPEMFTRWDITSYQVDRHPLSGVAQFVGASGQPVEGYEAYPGQSDTSRAILHREGRSRCE